MSEPTVIDVHGANAIVANSKITFDFADLGIQSSTPTAEQIVAAIVNKWKLYLNESNQASNPDIQITIRSSITSLIPRNNQTYREKQVTFAFQTIDSESNEIVPSEY